MFIKIGYAMFYFIWFILYVLFSLDLISEWYFYLYIYSLINILIVKVSKSNKIIFVDIFLKYYYKTLYIYM